MKYEYKCVNIQCNERNDIKIIEKPMNEAGKSEYCKECGEVMQKIFGSPSIKTNDGYKS
jgi:predicted nucleic acid-binding Zn ribbon protein